MKNTNLLGERLGITSGKWAVKANIEEWGENFRRAILRRFPNLGFGIPIFPRKDGICPDRAQSLSFNEPWRERESKLNFRSNSTCSLSLAAILSICLILWVVDSNILESYDPFTQRHELNLRWRKYVLESYAHTFNGKIIYDDRALFKRLGWDLPNGLDGHFLKMLRPLQSHHNEN